MKKFVLISMMATVMGLAFVTPAFATVTREGPYGPSTAWTDYGTCYTAWASIISNSTYIVSPINNDGTYNVKLKVSGRFTTFAGDAPGACGTTGPGTSNGDTILANVHGHVTFTFYLVVSGGTFNPDATCDASCAFDGYGAYPTYPSIDKFVTTFFGDGATWSFSTVKPTLEVAKSANSALCKNAWTTTYFGDGSSGILTSTGDIATTCPTP